MAIQSQPHSVGALVLPETYSVPAALEAVQHVFERYQRLADEVVRATVRGSDLERILPLFADVLVNPVALFDAACVFIGATSVPAPDKRDHVWEEVLATGGAGSEALRQGQLDLLRGRFAPEPFAYEGLEAFTASVTNAGETVVIMASTDANGPFTPGQVSILRWIQRLLEELWSVIARNLERKGPSDQVLVQVLNGTPIGEHLVLPYLARRSWDADDRYQVVSVYRNGPEGFPSTDRASARLVLEGLFPDARAQDDEVLVVLHEPEDVERRGYGHLRDVLRERRLVGAASDVVGGFFELATARSQCRAVRSMGDGAPAGTLTRFHDVCGAYLVRTLSKVEDLDTFCLPGVRALLSRPNGTELVHSLRVYVMNGRNMAAAARELCLHRNTLSYRMGQVEDCIGITLDELDETDLFRLYLTCLTLEEGGGATSRGR